MKLWMKIFIGLFLGALTGFVLGPEAIYLKPLGTIFLSLINMIIVLLVLSSMTVGITSIHDPKKLGRVGLKTLGFYLLTTLISILLGLAAAKLFHLGEGLGLGTAGDQIDIQLSDTPSIGEILLSIIPSNPIAAMVQGNILQVIFFAIFLGVAINFAGEKGKPLLDFLDSLADVMYRLTSLIMEFAPIGVFGIMAWVTGTFGIALLLPMLKFLIIFYLACSIHVCIVFCGLLKFVGKLQAWPFFKGMSDAVMVAFSTCSSSATLPVSMHCAQENLGISKNITGFILPLGSTINMNGTALFQAMSALFIAAAYDIHLNLYSLLTLVLTATLSAIGTAGIPGAGFIMLSAVFTSVGLPLEGLAILASIDRLREMVATPVNILGDAVVALVIAKQEGELNEQQYYHTERVEFEGSDV